MKLRTFIWIACVLNLGLIFSIVRHGDRTADVGSADRTPAEKTPNATVVPIATTAAAGTNGPDPAAATANATGPPFRWEQVESEDYLKLIENLRGIGCPDDTIRDIVTARVQDDYADAAWEAQKPLQAGFWEMMGKIDDMSDIVLPDQVEDRLESIQAESKATLVAVARQFATNQEPYRLNSDRWSFLSADLREQVRDIHEQIERTREELRREMSQTEDPAAEAVLRESISGLNAKRTEAIKAVIGEENWARYEATRNRSANWIRSLHGLTLAAEEMQEIARERDELERQRPPRPRNATPEEQAEYQLKMAEITAQQQLLVAKSLGEERAEQVQRAADGDYLTMRKVARRHGLPLDVADRAYEVKQTARTQLDALLARDLDDERRLQATAALLLTVKAELAGLYGEQAWPSYEKYGLAWFEQLTASAELAETEAAPDSTPP